MAFQRKSLIDIFGGEDKDGPTYTLVFKVVMEAGDGPFAVRSAVGISYGDVYSFGAETDALATAAEISEKPVGTSRTDWTVTVVFKRAKTEDGGQESENPLTDPVEVEWDYEERQKVIERDVSGNRICNSAKDRYDEIIFVDDFRRLLRIRRNEASFPKSLADALSNKTNAATWNGYAAKQVKLKPIRASRAYNKAIGFYWVVSYEFQFAAIGEDWKRYILDAGLNEIVSGTKRQMKLDGKPTTVPLALNGSGVQLATAGTPVYNSYELIGTADFSLLNLNGVI